MANATLARTRRQLMTSLSGAAEGFASVRCTTSPRPWTWMDLKRILDFCEERAVVAH